MKYLLKIFALLTFLSLNLIDAQQVVKVDTISGTPLSMSMDKKIGDLLENLEDKCTTKIANNPGKIGTPMMMTLQKRLRQK